MKAQEDLSRPARKELAMLMRTDPFTPCHPVAEKAKDRQTHHARSALVG